MADARLARYYDRLGRWNAVARVIGYDGGHRALTLHRALADPAAHGRTTTTRLHDVLAEHLPPLSSPRVLDAGCGLGGTLLDLARRAEGTFVGVTLSPRQASIASEAARAQGLGHAVRIVVGSYDDPPRGPFDVVLAIESLAHSAAPSVSVAALAATLAPLGTLVIVDDMPVPGAEGSRDLLTFKAGWRCPVLWGREHYVGAFAEQGLRLVVDLDLTDECRPRALRRIAHLERLNRVVRQGVPWAGWREVMDIHYGGLALERLTRTGAVRYRLLMARRD